MVYLLTLQEYWVVVSVIDVKIVHLSSTVFMLNVNRNTTDYTA